MMTPFSFHRGLLGLGAALLLANIGSAQTTHRISVDSAGNQVDNWSGRSSISADGRHVAFASAASDLAPGITNGVLDIFVHDRQTAVTERVSVSSFGVEANAYSTNPVVSADGRFVAFESDASNLVPGDTNGNTDIFLHDRQTGVTERISISHAGLGVNRSSLSPSISADGMHVTFYSTSPDLVLFDYNHSPDIFVRDRIAGTTERISTSAAGAEADDGSWVSALSSDGRFVAFTSEATNLVSGDTNGASDVFVKDRQTGLVTRVSVTTGGIEGNGASAGHLGISADGRHITFQSVATNLAFSATQAWPEIFVHDRQGGQTNHVSIALNGLGADSWSKKPAISADGRFVTYESWASDLVPGDTNADLDVFVFDRLMGLTERLSLNSVGIEAAIQSGRPSISADGRLVSFDSLATNLVAGDSNSASDIFLRDRWDGEGQNSIHLIGPGFVPVGFPMNLSWYATRGDSQYRLAYSRNLNGLVLGGHVFDIGHPISIVDSGVNASNGYGSFSSSPIPVSAAGVTVYFEVAAMDGNGVPFDSNAFPVTFY